MQRVLTHGLALAVITITAVASTCGQKDPIIVGSEEPTQIQIIARDGDGTSVSGVPITLDGVSVGTTPLTVDVAPGAHDVQLVQAEGYYASPSIFSLDVPRGESVDADFSYREGFPRTVLMEDFTNTGCIPCVGFEEQLVEETSEYTIDELIHVSVHHRTPAPDPMHFANPSELYARGKDFYGIAGTPSVATDGVITSSVPPAVGSIIDKINSQLEQRSPISLEVTANVVGSNIEAEVTLEALADVPGNTRLVALSIQDNIVYDTAPGSNGLSEFHHVVRDFQPNLDGDDIEGQTIDITAGMMVTFTFSLPLITNGNPPDDPSECRCVVFVQDWDTKVVHQSASTFD